MQRDTLGILFLTVPQTEASLQGEALVVDLPGAERQTVPLQEVAGVVAFPDVRITLPAALRCADLGKPVALIGELGEVRARVVGPLEGAAELRLAQYGSYASEDRRLQLARDLLAGKVRNAAAALGRYGDSGETRREMLRLASALDASPDLDALRGLEGAASQAYFDVFGAAVPSPYAGQGWQGRTRRPPRDPVNALLSFIGTILTHECSGALESVGLDPAVGFLHELRPGRASLACDLVEEFRAPLVDRFCLGLCRTRTVLPEDFEGDPAEGVLLTGDGRRKVLRAYETRKRRTVAHPGAKEPVPIGILPFLQASELARAIRQQRPYVSAVFR